MSKSQNNPKPLAVPVKTPSRTASAAPKVETHAVRETVESIVIAFVLAFLFRTFEAEAFVIPTGSMAPTLMGRHKDVECPKCGYRYEVSASEEESEDRRRPTSDCIAGMCPVCRYVLPMRPDLPPSVQDHNRTDIAKQPSYNGDRILVNKYLYTFSDPQRWDVVVFKFPGDAKVNYIKRLVGLPGESLRIYQGDIFVRPAGATKDEDFKIERKPPDKVLAMRQLVHDTEHDPAELDAAGWPLRWHAPPGDPNRWQLEKSTVGNTVRQRYSIDATGDTTSWLRYEHIVPTYDVWQQITNVDQGAAGQKNPLFSDSDRSRLRHLVTDSNPYNGREDYARLTHSNRVVHSLNSLEIDQIRQGLHWVGELMLEADVDVQSSSGELLFDLVEGGRHFSCKIDLKSGEAKLSAANLTDYAPKAQTAITGPGKHHVAFANVDEQLLLWVDGKSIAFEGDTAYDAAKIFGQSGSILPQTGEKDLGDLAPAGIGARGAKLSITRLQLWRDIYYIADSWERPMTGGPVNDFGNRFDEGLLNLPADPSIWNRWSERRKVEFPLTKDQLFVMGDNSAESSDARLWLNGDHGRPGGAYLDRRLLIGKALCVYWPHSWNQIPGTPIPFPAVPQRGGHEVGEVG